MRPPDAGRSPRLASSPMATTDAVAHAHDAPLRDRIVRAATALTSEAGWSAVTMGRLAETVGVSRQTVHNEIGSKRRLAEEVVFAELQQFLTLVDAAFRSHPADLPGAVRAACRDILLRAADSPLIHAVVSTSHGARHDLLPLLTTQSATLIDTAKIVVRTRVAPMARPLDDRELAAATDILVRTILSHVMQPSAAPEETADDMAWLAGQLLT